MSNWQSEEKQSKGAQEEEGTKKVKMWQRDQEERGYKKVGQEEEDGRDTER